jgi:carboxypeptidase C (cathepsin A)
VVVADPDPKPAGPYRTVDNEFGLLDKSDLVMIDPVGTGLSHAVCDHQDAEFWGVDPDIDSISRFIAQYLSDNERWSSPKYLLGESYGTTRAAAIVNYLRARRSLAFNGLILVSVATDIEAIFAELPGNDRPYAVYLPAYAAVAWYHKRLPNQPAALEPFLAEVRAYALGVFASALLQGDALSEPELDAAAQKMHEYTGLSVEYVKAAHLRVPQSAFTHELLKAQRLTVGRLDGRFVGPTWDPLEKDSDYDPQSAAISAAYAATFLDYYHGELKFGQGSTYNTTNFSIGDQWKWTHKTAKGDQPVVNTGVDLAEALIKDASLKVLVLNGYYDLATPFCATEYVMSHLGVPAQVGARISMKYYEAGRRAGGAAHGAARRAATGSTICALRPGWLSSNCSTPPCSLATASTMLSPRPTPGVPRLESPRKKRSVALGLSASAIPGPSSATAISTAPSARRPTRTLMAPRSETHFRELSMRLLTACASSTGSPATAASPADWNEKTTPFCSATGS